MTNPTGNIPGLMQVAVDIVVRRGDEILLIRRKNDPFKDCLALPGGFIDPNETAYQAACRELTEETGILVKPRQMKLIGVYSNPGRDPRGRVLSIGYYCKAGMTQTAIAGDDAAGAEWAPLERMGALAFDHAKIIEMAAARFFPEHQTALAAAHVGLT